MDYTTLPNLPKNMTLRKKNQLLLIDLDHCDYEDIVVKYRYGEVHCDARDLWKALQKYSEQEIE